MALKKQKANPPVVLPVGGGKGGIGKSVITANLGLALARLEHRAIVVDADLGGSDLHNILGQGNDEAGLGEVLTSKDLTVDQVVRPVLEPRFRFVAGDALVVATANPSFQKKRKLLHDIKGLDADFVLLDLGAGTSITVMDFFSYQSLVNIGYAARTARGSFGLQFFEERGVPRPEPPFPAQRQNRGGAGKL